MSSARDRHRSIRPRCALTHPLAFWILLLFQSGGQSLPADSSQGRKTSNTLTPAVTAGLSLDLSLEDPDAIYGASLRFALALTNTGDAPVNLKDGSPENRAFSVQVYKNGKLLLTGDSASTSLREGEHFDVPRKQSRRTFNQGETWRVKGDLVAWVGDLLPGSYRLTARYEDAPFIFAVSKPVEILIRDCAVVYSHPVRNLDLVNEPRDTAWIHHGPGGFDIFLLRSSPKYPPVTYSNRLIAHRESESQVFTSAVNIADQSVRHMVWLDAGGTLQVVRIAGDGDAGTPLTLPTPSPVASIVDPPFTDEQGTLFSLFLGANGNALLLELPAGGKARFTQLPMRLPPTTRLLWCRDNTLLAAWTGPDAMEFYDATIPLDGRPRRPDIRKFPALPAPALDILLAQRYHDSDDGLDRLAVVLCRDAARNQFVQQRMNLSAGKTEVEERFSAGAAISMSLIDSILDREFRPRFLFCTKDDSMHFFNSDFVRDVQIKSPNGRIAKRSDFPTLYLSSEFSKKPGTYVRFVEAGRFVYVKVE